MNNSNYAVIHSINKLAPSVVAAFNKIHVSKETFRPSNLGKQDSANRWYPADPIAVKYCKNFRAPSRTYPHSYLQACLTDKFVAYYFGYTPTELAAHKLIQKAIAAPVSQCAHETLASFVKLANAAKRLEKKLVKGGVK